MKVIPVRLKETPYNIYIDKGTIGGLNKYIKALKLGNSAIIVTCSTVHRLYSKKIKKHLGAIDSTFVVLPDGEEAKTRENLFAITAQAIKAEGQGKKLFFVALGGGTVGDVTGFAASIYKRGTPYIQIPTTLLAQIDSSIGGKTAIDLKEAKNILGTFCQPKAVFIDIDFLKTLSLREIAQGVAEAVKYGLIRDKKLFHFLDTNHKKIMAAENTAMLKIIIACAAIKAKIVAQDPLEKKGLRTILNFGHTFGHTIEASTQYKSLSHGEAIAIGMVYATNLSLILGKCTPRELSKVIAILKKFSLPVTIATAQNNFYETMKYDKKFIAGKVRMVLLNQIGKVEVCSDISQEKVEEALDIFKALNVASTTA